jgi:hypothetical protein
MERNEGGEVVRRRSERREERGSEEEGEEEGAKLL